jgi:acyl-CoA dehydrogenase
VQGAGAATRCGRLAAPCSRGTAYGAAADAIDTRAICLIRETLARHSGLADFAFAMQAWAPAPISLDGTPEQKQRYLARVARGEAISAFALSEPDAGSDVAAMACEARVDGDHAVLNGEKTWISNGGIADFYVVFARSGEAAGARGYRHSSSTPARRLRDRRAHRRDRAASAGPLRFTNCRVPLTQRVGAAGEGFKVAMRTLDVFRTVGGRRHRWASRGARSTRRCIARRRARCSRACSPTSSSRRPSSRRWRTTIDSAALLTYRAAWQRDQGRNVTREAAMAKLTATEGAQQVIDAAVQIFGGLGVVSEQPVERLYREIRSLRIYEGATEVQQLIIARELLKDVAK